MKILILSQYFSPDLSAGSFRVTSLVDEFSKQLKQNDTLDIFTTYPHRYDSIRKEINTCLYLFQV